MNNLWILYIFSNKSVREGGLETGNFFFQPEKYAVYGRSSKDYAIIAESYR